MLTLGDVVRQRLISEDELVGWLGERAAPVAFGVVVVLGACLGSSCINRLKSSDPLSAEELDCGGGAQGVSRSACQQSPSCAGFIRMAGRPSDDAPFFTSELFAPPHSMTGNESAPGSPAYLDVMLSPRDHSLSVEEPGDEPTFTLRGLSGPLLDAAVQLALGDNPFIEYSRPSEESAEVCFRIRAREERE
jgi:hypothetical protein